MSGVSINVTTGEVTASNIAAEVYSIADQQADARAARDAALKASDWSVLPDVTCPNAAAWTTYRQALRDISLATSWSTDPAAALAAAMALRPV